MTQSNRGGQVLKTGKIGRVNCLRQQLMMPGETINARLAGNIKLEALRERDSLRINAHLATFLTPIRWLWPEFPDYLKEGPGTAITPPSTNRSDFAALGVGAYNNTGSQLLDIYEDAVLRIYNEWYKWPEDADNNNWGTDGEVACPLSCTWSRVRNDATPGDPDDYTQASVADFDVRDLAQIQGRFKSAMKRDVLSFNRYMELVGEMYGADGSREVDQVPMMIDSTEVGVNPRELPATDGASLGQWQSYFDFNVDHAIRGITAPEHCMLTYMLTVRFAPIVEERAPLTRNDIPWASFVGDPDILSQSMPEAVNFNQVLLPGSPTQMGYLPAGWQWRAGFNVVGDRIDQRDSFPYMNNPGNNSNLRDATRIKDAFRSQSLGDYVVDVYFTENSHSRINNSVESYYSGMTNSRNDSEFPFGGKQL